MAMAFAISLRVSSSKSNANPLHFLFSTPPPPPTHTPFMSNHPAPDDPAQGQASISLAPLPREPRSPRAEKWIVAGWVLILVKCGVLWWAIIAYNVPIHPLWLVAPTIAFAALASALYIWRD